MQSWEIEMVEKMTEDEQKKFKDKLVSKYKDEIQKLKYEKKMNNAKAMGSCAWRVGLIASAIAIFVGPAMMVYGEGIVKAMGDAVAISSIGGFVASIFGAIISADDGPKDILLAFEAAKNAREQIKELKEKIKEVQKKPVMNAR